MRAYQKLNIFLMFLFLTLFAYSQTSYASSAVPKGGSSDIENQQPVVDTSGSGSSTSNKNDGLSGGAIAGIVIAVAVVVGAAVGIPAALGVFGAAAAVTTLPPTTTLPPIVTTEYVDPLADYISKNCSRPEATPYGPKIAIRWDDGHKSLYPFAMNLFALNNLPSMALVVTDKVGEPGYLTWEQLSEMKAKGWEVGSHSKTHANLSAASDKQLLEELKGSKKTLEDHGYNVSSFAWPFGANAPKAKALANTLYEDEMEFPGNRYNLPAYNDAGLGALSIEYNTSLTEVINEVETVKNKSALGILTLHNVLKDDDEGYRWGATHSFLINLVDYLACAGVPIINIEDLKNLPKTDLITNGHFSEPLSVGWHNSTDFVLRDNNTNGKAPESQYSVKLTGNPDEQTELISKPLGIDTNSSYQLGAFVNTINLTGYLNFYVDEYNAEGNWINGAFLGSVGANRVTVFRGNYKASSSGVSTVDVKAYLNSGDTGHAYLDRFEFLLVN